MSFEYNGVLNLSFEGAWVLRKELWNVNEEEGFEKDPLLAREPVNLLKDTGDVVTARAAKSFGCTEGYLDFEWCAIKNAVAIVNSECSKGINQSCRSRVMDRDFNFNQK